MYQNSPKKPDDLAYMIRKSVTVIKDRDEIKLLYKTLLKFNIMKRGISYDNL